MDPTAARVLDVWFGSHDVNGPVDGAMRARWFASDATFDAAIREEFGERIPLAASGAMAAWEETPGEALALVIVLDQLSRNVFRNDRRAFEWDGVARAIVERALARGHDLAVSPVHRPFFYLPFEHAEDLAQQDRSVALFRALAAETASGGAGELVEYAEKHRNVIARFGRFPHRNAVLGRESTAEELEFLRGGRWL